MHISAYGVLISLGMLSTYGVSMILSRGTGLHKHIDRVFLWALIPGVVCARLLFVLYHPNYFLQYPTEIIAVWHGGWVWHGALAGGLLGIWVYCKRTTLSLLALLDTLAPGVALGQAIGRWGNFFNQEAYGLPTNVPWSIPIDTAHRLPGFEQFARFHPTFLYESSVDLGLFLLLSLLFLSSRPKGGIPSHLQSAGFLGKLGMTQGVLFFIYLFLYSTARFGIEFLRIDSVPTILGLRAPQWISVVLLLVGVAGLVRVLHKQKKLVY